jgi:hypothetical protein
MLRVCSTIVLLRVALSELQRSESLPAVHFISLSLSYLFWLPAHAPCLLYYSSPQSCNAQSPPLPSKTLRGTPSLLAVSVWPLRERLGQSTVTVQHRLLLRANVSRMYAECFDKVLYHVNSQILKCKMTNVITRIVKKDFTSFFLNFFFIWMNFGRISFATCYNKCL